MKRVVIVCRGCGEGGSVARVALRQARELARAFEVVVVSDSFAAGPAPFKTVLVPVRPYRALRRFAHVPHELSFARAAGRALIRLDAERPVGFVLTHSHVVAHRSALLLRSRSAVPFGLVAHGDIFDRPSGMYDPLLTMLYRHATPRAYQASDLIIALSPHMAGRAEATGAAPDRVHLVPYGVDVAELGLTNPGRKAFSSGPLRLLFVGRLALEKNVESLIDACVVLMQRGIGFRLEVIGDGPRAAQLRERAVPLGDRVRFSGQKPRSELGAVYADADVTCAPSSSEALPGVVLESLACGTPVVASDIGPHRFLIEDGRNGLLAKTTVEMADAFASLANDRALLQRLSEGAARSVERFTWSAVGDELIALIRPYAE